MLALTPLELATNTVVGIDPDADSLPAVPRNLTVLSAMEAAVLPAVARPPCVVTFSGGRDSSLVLAVAARVARREGLPAPLPATLRFVDNPTAEETSWQEMVISHLGLDDWIRLDVHRDIDFIGPLSANVLRRHGVLWPLNAYLHEALIHHAAGGSIMTGMYGDSVFGGGTWTRANEVLARRARPEPRDTLRLGLAFAPRRVRALVARRRAQYPPWLRPEAGAEFAQRFADFQATDPRRLDRWLDRFGRRRSVGLSSASMDLLAVDADAACVQPLGDRRVLAAIANQAGAFGLGDRTTMMRTFFGDVLPDAVLARHGKAVFADAFIGDTTRDFARNWDGRDVDITIVDPEALQASWLAPVFDFGAALLLQTAWLTQERRAAASF